MQEINGDPQFTTQGVYQQADDISPGPQEGQRGVPVPKAAPKPKRRGRKSVAARRGLDETRKKDRTGRKAKNAGQLRNPMARKRRQMGPTGRARNRTEIRAKGKALTEASGGITLENVGEVARTGVDRISIGALTHSAPALDISLDVLKVS